MPNGEIARVAAGLYLAIVEQRPHFDTSWLHLVATDFDRPLVAHRTARGRSRAGVKNEGGQRHGSVGGGRFARVGGVRMADSAYYAKTSRDASNNTLALYTDCVAWLAAAQAALEVRHGTATRCIPGC